MPHGANVITSCTLYKVEKNDHGTQKLKARIAPHARDKNFKDVLGTECTICPPPVLRIIESISSTSGWTIYRAEVTSSLLQTGMEQRDVHVRLFRENIMKSTRLWLLLTAPYGLVSANAKWYHQSEKVTVETGLNHSFHIPQLFYKMGY